MYIYVYIYTYVRAQLVSWAWECEERRRILYETVDVTRKKEESEEFRECDSRVNFSSNR